MLKKISGQKQMTFKIITLTFLILSTLSGCSTMGLADPKHQEYSAWLEDLKAEMHQRGISKATLKTVYAQDYYHPVPEVVKIDRKQPEFALTSTDYLNRIINTKRIQDGQQHYQQLAPLLQNISAQYEVPAEYIIAFWGAETSYGRNFGGYQVVAVLTQLSYDQRRPDFFREQLCQALKILDTWPLNYTQLQGSWAGAMGHFQFMPGTFNAYAVDYNQDGTIDIWNSFDDAAASAANYLNSMGWIKDQPWGMPVRLPKDFDYTKTGRNNTLSIAQWQTAGVLTMDAQKLPLNSQWQASIILPDGKQGRAYLILDNFRIIMRWNRSENYALAIGILADHLKSKKKWQALPINSVSRPKTADIRKIQVFANHHNNSKLEADGQLGEKTREAIKKLQLQNGLIPDGYPDQKLLNKINKN